MMKSLLIRKYLDEKCFPISTVEVFEMTSSLAELFTKYGTDKEAIHHYSGFYECLFQARRFDIKSLLEIGIGTLIPEAHSSMCEFALEGYKPGGSLRAWRDYFPNAHIYGIDVMPDTQFSEERITTYICDSTNPEAVLNTPIPREFDIIIDDGAHETEHQLATLKNLFPSLRPNGIYVAEDTYGNQLQEKIPLIQSICSDNPLFFMWPLAFFNGPSALIIGKRL
jgi:hypothetical protein